MSNPAETRRQLVRDLSREPLDILIIGGGIVGAGVARDAAMRGLRTGLIEQHDFAFGTSSRSSRLLHGGLRYLAQGRIGLVHQGSKEKTILHQIAPHLAQPLPFIFPTYGDNPEWRLWQLKIGVKVYDVLCHGRNFGKSTWLKASEVLRKVPGLRTTDLKGAVRYFDAFTNDARLTLDTLRSAANHGAVVLNYCRFANARRTGGWECDAEDRQANERFLIRARTVVNATGPWADGLPHSHLKLRLTKGVHVVVDRRKVGISEALVMTEDKRVLFAIPWGDRMILGTTDTDYHGPLDTVEADAQDIDYILHITNRYFPHATLQSSDVISTWAGLRPLIADGDGVPSDISRAHQIANPEPGWWDVGGGKLTTYRLIAEETLDRILATLSDGARDEACRTATVPLLEGKEQGFSGIVPPDLSRAAVEHYCRNEWALHLVDIMIRRTSWHQYLHKKDERVTEVVDWMGQILGWSRGEMAAELKGYQTMHSRNDEVRDQPLNAAL